MSSRRRVAVGLMVLGTVMLIVAAVLGVIAATSSSGDAPSASVKPAGVVPDGAGSSTTTQARPASSLPDDTGKPGKPRKRARSQGPRLVIPTRNARLSALGDRAPDPAAVPVAIRIDTIGTDAAVEPSGVEPTGALDIPEDVDAIGWYRYGAVPGAEGVTVLAGHVDSRSQGRGALFRLGEVEPGSLITLTRADGTALEYVAVARRQYVKTQLPAEVWERAGPSRLAIITCGGPFDAVARSYRDNVVVWAEPR